MRNADVVKLFEYSYWSVRRVLATAARVSDADLTAPSALTFRDLRATLVHTLDVERSWRQRLQGEPAERWEGVLDPADYPDAAAIAEHWSRDEAEMRAWLATLEDDALASVADLGNADRFPLWYYLVHVVTHTTQQLRDAALLATAYGHSPGDLEFLYYADHEAGRP